MNKKEVILILKKSMIPIVLLAWITSFLVVIAVKYFHLLPTTYITQSQLVITPKITDEKDIGKSMDLLKYNENYSLLVYSSSFLEKTVKEFNNQKYSDPLKLKPHIKVLYSGMSQVLTLQTSLDNEKDGITLTNLMLEKLKIEGNRLFSQNSLSILSYAVTTNKFSYSTSLLLIVSSLVLFILYLTIVLFYQNRRKGERYDYANLKYGVINNENNTC